ncbi:hypothetical protein [Hymenobacter lapidiphilus]|uniref:Uncharacterized protein n=1 Tax=Hymenobacter lapidiphilus TaxID=2608003 RepID=A0A7Y7U890_9BACT|nr:hypothetical protein [Hymenobacter lapidiphilus]NVO33315.1 hypothetical protein [Hymenobacter lapidiphilus]
MYNNLPSQTKKEIKWLAYYQIAGGIIGLLTVLVFLFNLSESNWLLAFIFIPAVLLYLFSIGCGRRLLGENVESGLRISMINQLIQVFGLSAIGYAFAFASGVSMWVELDLTDDFNFSVEMGLSKFDFKVASEEQVISVSINIVALVLIHYIGKLKQELAYRSRLKFGEF